MRLFSSACMVINVIVGLAALVLGQAPGPCPDNALLDEAILIPGVTDGRRCWNVTQTYIPGSTAKVYSHLFGYTWDQPAGPYGGIYLVLSQGCQYTQKKVRQWVKSNYPHTLPVVFADPRGSGLSTPMWWNLFCDDTAMSTPFPSAKCASTMKNKYDLGAGWNPSTLAADLHSILQQVVGTQRTGFYGALGAQVRVVAGDLVGQMWLQLYFQYYTPNPDAILQVYMQNPIDLDGSFSLFDNLLVAPEQAVRRQLSLCMRDSTCALRFGGRDLNQLLDDLMLSAKQNELTCNSKIAKAWPKIMGSSVGAPSPIFVFYSELLNMLVGHPLEPLDPRYWPEEFQSWIPAALYRILRCDDDDVTVLLSLYKDLQNYATTDDEAAINPVGPFDPTSKCYVNNFIKWTLIFATLQKQAPPALDTLLDAAYTKTVLPNVAYIKDAYAAYGNMNLPLSEPIKVKGTYTGGQQFRAMVGGAHPGLGSGGHSNFVLGRRYLPPNKRLAGGVTVSNFPGIVNPLYGKENDNTANNVAVPGYTNQFNNSCGIASVLWDWNLAQHPPPSRYPGCYTEMLTGDGYSDFEGVKAHTAAMRKKFFDKSSGDIWTYSQVAVEPPLYPEAPLAYITTPLPPGQAFPPTPVPTMVPGATGAAKVPGESYSEDIHAGGSVKLNIVGLVFGVIFGLVVLIAIIYVMNKCLKKRFSDPTKRDFMNEVYGDKGAANQWK